MAWACPNIRLCIAFMCCCLCYEQIAWLVSCYHSWHLEKIQVNSVTYSGEKEIANVNHFFRVSTKEMQAEQFLVHLFPE